MPEIPLIDLHLDAASIVPLFEQVYDGLRQRIVSGQILAGSRLPPSRKLAQELGVSRTTIVTAYEQLEAEGFVQGRPGAGVYVTEIGEVESRALSPAKLKAHKPTPEGLKAFHPGQMDDRLFPYQKWAQCVSKVARTDPKALVVSSDPFGDFELRVQICRYLADWRGVNASPDQVMITAGSGDALEICVRTLLKAGDTLALEDPGYPPLRTFVESYGLKACWLDTDEHGVMPPKGKAKMTILTPSSHFPLGGALPQVRRNAFLKWAANADSWIIEDDYDSEFRYAGRPIPALASLDTQERTVYVGSFSKIFSNGLRLGFLVMPQRKISAFTHSLRKFGGKASVAPQRALALFMKTGDFYRHIRRVRRIYGERRTVLMQLIDEHLGDIGVYEDYRAGMQIAVKLNKGYDDQRIAKAAADHGIVCFALSGYYASKPPQQGLLLGFCSFTEDEMTRAMVTLKVLINRL
ncbi:MAG: aspartate aminotransferase [Rhodospirillaceae bacterium]|nr:MAG: aspartate aminotransferase [Rhodospirillaceae bacterium]